MSTTKNYKIQGIDKETGMVSTDVYFIGTPSLKEALREAADSSITWAAHLKCVLVTGHGVHEVFTNGEQTFFEGR